MDITVNQKRLMGIVKGAERIIARGNSLPILQSILLKTEIDNMVRVLATNLELGVNYLIPAKINDSGSVAVPAKLFSDFISNVNDEKVTISSKNNVMSINSERYKSQIQCLNPEEFPIIPSNNGQEKFKVQPALFKDGLASVINSTAFSEARPELSGVYINFTENQAEFAATDSYRLSEKVMPLKSSVIKEIILPRNTATELMRLLENIEGDIDVSFYENQIFFNNDDFELVSRLVEGRYPEYRKVIPDKFISLARFKKDELEKVIKTASIFSSNISDVKIKVTKGKAEIYSKNSDKGELNATLDCELKNEPFELTANYNYVLDGIKSITTPNLIIQFTGEGSPLIVRPENKKDFTYLIMPLRS